MKTLLVLGLLLQAEPPARLKPPQEVDGWIVPARDADAEPVWGIKGGISEGLWPTGGPRGLPRIHAPYLGPPRLRMINYIAVEPIVDKVRGLSELERSDLDKTAGKRMWTENEKRDDPEPGLPRRPARGKFVEIEKGRRARETGLPGRVPEEDHGRRVARNSPQGMSPDRR